MTVLMKFVVTLEMSEETKDTTFIERELLRGIRRYNEVQDLTDYADPAYVVSVESVKFQPEG